MVSNWIVSVCNRPGDETHGRVHDASVQPRQDISRSDLTSDRATRLSPQGVDERREMRWTEYAIAMLLFSGVSMALLYIIERTQRWLPFNPQKFANVEPALAFGTAASFTTNTNWQAYSGESTMSYLTQMAGLAYHNFESAAVGIVPAIVVIRGIARKE